MGVGSWGWGIRQPASDPKWVSFIHTFFLIFFIYFHLGCNVQVPYTLLDSPRPGTGLRAWPWGPAGAGGWDNLPQTPAAEVAWEHLQDDCWSTGPFSVSLRKVFGYSIITCHRCNSFQENPIGHYHNSMMFRWEPEGCYRCTKSNMVRAPFWFSTEHRWTALSPFWFSVDNLRNYNQAQ